LTQRKKIGKPKAGKKTRSVLVHHLNIANGSSQKGKKKTPVANTSY
jgi:hypothetical protein